MAREILIFATPPGNAPEWVRKEFIGLILPVVDIPDRLLLAYDHLTEVDSGYCRGRNLPGYDYNVLKNAVFDALEAVNPEAARCFKSIIYKPEEVHWFVFPEHVCQLLLSE